MNDSPSTLPREASELQRLLHGVNDELSVAVLELALLLEDAPLDPSVRSSVQESLTACNRSASLLREVWLLL
ncbi:MAG: hypothetical protein IPJ97_11380 [Proteobacteria bacterium]|nr:hypothetical protein [Pseudomonadota bacterium]